LSKASVYFELENIDGKSDVAKLKQQIDTLPGVISVSVNQGRRSVAVDFDTTGASQNQIRAQLDGLGFNICEEHFEEHIM